MPKLQLIYDKQTLTVDFWTNSGNVRHFFGFFCAPLRCKSIYPNENGVFLSLWWFFFSIASSSQSTLHLYLSKILQYSRLPSDWKFSGEVSGNVQWRCSNASIFQVETQIISKMNELIAICSDRRNTSELNWKSILWKHFQRHKKGNVVTRCNIHIKWNYVGSLNLVCRTNSPAAHERRRRRVKKK